MPTTGRKKNAPPVSLAPVRSLPAVPTRTLDRDTAPTPERLAKVGLTLIQVGGGRVRIVGSDAGAIVHQQGDAVRVISSPLDKLHARRRLDEADPDRNDQLFQAGELLRQHHHRGGLSGFTGATNDRGSSSADPSQREGVTEAMENGRRAYRSAQKALDPDDWSVTYAVVIQEQTLEAVGKTFGLGNRTVARPIALDRLRRGLRILAERWGLLTAELVSADAANVNAARSIGATVKVGASPNRPVDRGCARGRMPDRDRSEPAISGPAGRREKRSR